jgi:hypothetical protein
MGSSIENSELVALARQTTGVTRVDLSTVSLARKNKIAEAKIQLELNEYFMLDNVEINVISENTLDS